VPGGAFFSLDTVLVTYLHQQLAFIQQGGQLAAQCAGALGEVFHQKIRQGIDGGANADFVIATGELVDEEHQTTGAGHEALVIRAFDPNHGFLMHLARQDA
jgi:hypothetical protein